VLLVALWATAPAMALQQPRAIATDSRIRTVRFSENEVYQFIGHYGFQSSIEFGHDEVIQTVSIGDSVAWLVNPSGNRLFLKPIEQNALTNMTVITDKHSYLFELHAEETKNIRDKELIFTLRFIYPQNEVSETGVSQFEEFPEVDKHPEKFNFSYSVRGSPLIEPLRIFDDGEFTYFEFRDKNAEIPAFFRVNSAMEEELINFRKRGDYIVVERVTSRFTLRRGPDILCVYNDKMPLPTVPPQPKSIIKRVRDYNPF
jgi:type IV secretion system protein VirB9